MNIFQLTVVLLIVGAATGQSETFYYTYGTDKGGFAKITATPTGFSNHQVIVQNGLEDPEKIALSKDSQRAVVIPDEGKKVWVCQLGDKPGLVSTLEIKGKSKTIANFGDHDLITASKGYFYWIDPAKGLIEKTWKADAGLTPPGHKGEVIFPLPNTQQALISFQKDGDDGSKGCRLVVFDLARFAPAFDLQLPRDHPDLHIAKSTEEQGPNPELIFVAPKSNTIALSEDLYGAMAFADYDSALQGKWKNYVEVPSSLDGSWGTAFPDRGLYFTVADKEYLLISNASKDGGIVLFDLAKRAIIQKFPCPAGAEAPIFLPKSNRAVTVISGKLKSRGETALGKTFSPGKELLVFDFAPLANGGEATLERIPFDQPVERVQAIASEGSETLLLAEGGATPQLLIYDLAAKKIVAQEPAEGEVQRIAK